jgi:hypothetical protein
MNDQNASRRNLRSKCKHGSYVRPASERKSFALSGLKIGGSKRKNARGGSKR